MSEDKNSGKWASEVFDFIRLLKRTGSSFFGLLILELGWILFLMLISRIYPVGDNPPPPTILLPSGKDIQIAQLLLPGVLIVFILWFFGSGFYIYLWIPLSLVIKLIVMLVLFLITALAWLVNAFIFPVTKLIENRLVANFLKNSDSEKKQKNIADREKSWMSLLELYIDWKNREKIREVFGKDVERALYSDNVSEDESAQIIKFRVRDLASREVALEEIKFRAWFLFIWVGSIFRVPISSFFSQANIGIAPIQSFSYDEEQTSIKLAAQVFSTAIDWTRWALKDIDAVEYVKFHILPEHVIPKDAVGAQKIKNWLNFDVLFWGSYITGSNKKIWINTSANLPNSDNEEYSKTEKWEERAIPKLFLRDYKVEPFVLAIDHDKPWQTYAILALALIMTIQSRKQRYEKDLIDKLSNDGSKKIDLIISKLIRDIFEKMSTSKEKSNYPSIEELMIDVAGNWIGYKIGDILVRDETVDFVSKNRLVFYKILQDCINRKPTITENYYRAGMLACFAEREEDALKLFSDVGSYEEKVPTSLAQAQIRTDVHLAILDLRSSHVGRSEAFRLSKLAAYIQQF